MLEMARQGRLPEAIEQLKERRAASSSDMRVLFDLIALLERAGRYKEAIETSRGIPENVDVPAYVFKAQGSAAIKTGDFATAEKAYRRVIQSSPDDNEAHAGLAHAWAAQGQVDTAIAHLDNLMSANKNRPRDKDLPLLVALAELHEKQGDWLQAASVYQDVLSVNGEFRYAVRGRVFALRRAGAAHLAHRLAEQNAAHFDQDEMRRLAQDAAGRAIAFAHETKGANGEAMRQALARNQEVTERYGFFDANFHDRLVALRDLSRMREVVELYTSSKEQSAHLPAYARVAVADALLYLERPDEAYPLYEQALAEMEANGNGPQSEWRASLAYAYSEAELHDRAIALADETVKLTPPILYKRVSELTASNPQYARAELQAATLRMYANRLQEARQRLEQLRKLAPANPDIQAAWASLLAAEGKPRAARTEFALLRQEVPEMVDAMVAHADVSLRLHDAAPAREVIGQLRQAGNKSVQRLEQELAHHDAARLKFETHLSGASERNGSSETAVRIESSPLSETVGEQFRVIGETSHASNAESTFARTRAGAGIVHRSDAGELEVMATRAIGDSPGSGLSLRKTWDISDQVRLHATYDSNVDHLAAAAYRSGITGKLAAAGATWALNERRMYGGELVRTGLSDSNTRLGGNIWWTEQWISGPSFKLGTSLTAAMTTNSRSDTPYFSPANDKEVRLTTEAEWLGWRRYQRAFRQRALVSVGSYRQACFGNSPLADVRYEHEWRDDPMTTIQYGIGRSMHSFDGVRESWNYGYLIIDWALR